MCVYAHEQTSPSNNNVSPATFKPQLNSSPSHAHTHTYTSNNNNNTQKSPYPHTHTHTQLNNHNENSHKTAYAPVQYTQHTRTHEQKVFKPILLDVSDVRDVSREAYDFGFKVAVVGDPSVGKSSLLRRMCCIYVCMCLY